MSTQHLLISEPHRSKKMTQLQLRIEVAKLTGWKGIKQGDPPTGICPDGWTQCIPPYIASIQRAYELQEYLARLGDSAKIALYVEHLKRLTLEFQGESTVDDWFRMANASAKDCTLAFYYAMTREQVELLD